MVMLSLGRDRTFNPSSGPAQPIDPGLGRQAKIVPNSTMDRHQQWGSGKGRGRV
jgi:hypothetical protein